MVCKHLSKSANSRNSQNSRKHLLNSIGDYKYIIFSVKAFEPPHPLFVAAFPIHCHRQSFSMKLSCISMSTSLVLFTSQACSHSTESSSRICHDYSILVNVTNLALTSSYRPFTSNYDVVDFANGLSGRDGGATLHLFSVPKNVTGVYTISSIICSPRTRTKEEKTILLASHGLGYDRR